MCGRARENEVKIEANTEMERQREMDRKQSGEREKGERENEGVISRQVLAQLWPISANTCWEDIDLTALPSQLR